jgi:hypothetical protein
LLADGVFYGNEYMKALDASGQTSRMNWLKEKGCFYHGLAPKRSFEMLSDPTSPTGIQGNHFIVQQGVAPVDALNDMRRGLSFIGCGEVCQLGQYEAVRDMLGDEKFNAIFSATSSTPLRVCQDLVRNPLLPLCQLQKKDPGPFRPGTIVFFGNVPLYQRKHTNGESAGFFTVCCSREPQLFTSLGLRSSGMSADEIGEVLRRDFNQPSIGASMVSEKVARRIVCDDPSLKEVSLSKEEFSSAGGGQIMLSMQLCAQRVDQLAKQSLRDSCSSYAEWFRREAPYHI